MLKRSVTEELLETLNHFPVLGIVGPRQVGKTTLARLLLKQIEKDAVFIDLERPLDLAKLDNPSLFFERNQDKCIVLDEIQRKPDLFPVLRAMIDDHRVPGRFLILGSASPHLMRDASESLAGRIAYEELGGLNRLEVIEANLTDCDMIRHWVRGGFPDSLLARSEKMQRKWTRNFIQTYVERDLPLLGLNVERSLIRKVWTMLAHIHGNVLNVSSISGSLGLTAPTVKRYIAFLEDAFLVRQLQPFSINIKKRLVKAPKIFIRDSGIYHALIGVDSFEDLEGNSVIGASWEGYVIEQICQLSPDDYAPYFYRTHQGSECDLVLVKGGKPKEAIEIKYTDNPKLTKGNRMAFSDLGAEHNVLITPSSDDYLIDENIRVCSLDTYLKQYVA
jgi:predicted AAA+ superfamily ATPase